MPELLQQIAQQSALRWPERPAFRYDGESLSYAELEARSNALAHTLQSTGVVPNDRVGLLLPKSLELPIAIYGVLKAGAVVVPLDSQLPILRLATIVESAGIHCLIATADQSDLLAKLTKTCAEPFTLAIGPSQVEGIEQCLPWRAVTVATTPPTVAIKPEDPAYLLFTSGSTGIPKGIVHSHRSALSYAQLAATTYGLKPDDVLANFAPLHFDQSTFEFYSAPLAGACTVMVPPGFAIAQASLAALLESEGCSLWYSVPSVMVQMLNRELLADRNLGRMRWVLFGGESFPSQSLALLRAAMPNARFSNVYGPTEVNQCTYFHIDDHRWDAREVPIGTTWEDTDYLILGPDNRSVPQGDSGELLIHSTTMMSGYWQRPDLDAAAFYEHEHQGVKRRFYRTGDQVSLNDAGQLLFRGRKDRQLKVRGYRVELDEIESALLSHPEVAEAASFAFGTGENLSVAACALPTDGSNLTPKALRIHLGQRLPRYAIPERIDVVDHLPRTSSIKIDRQALIAQYQQLAKSN
ncbi:MAG: amino acid adenylation domain-containing protein [Pseudomonadales bacterium]